MEQEAQNTKTSRKITKGLNYAFNRTKRLLGISNPKPENSPEKDDLQKYQLVDPVIETYIYGIRDSTDNELF